MLFNSYEFIFVFLPVAFLVYFFLNSKRLIVASKAWLVFVSLFFYSWWNIVYLPLILTSILFNYAITNAMIDKNKLIGNYFSKKRLLLVGLFFNVGLLSYFKYMDFFISNVNFVFGSDFELLYLALPLAISFFTLQQIAFLIDSYEGLVEERNFLDYVIFVSFFPQLIAGPIVHHKEMMPQFMSFKNKIKNYKNISLGVFIFSIGLFKKIVIADTFAVWATAGFDASSTLNFLEAWVTSLSYTFQLYFDFSGYTDMAIGAALLFNIRLPINFSSPYKATGMIDFWQRWHITLSNFITTYIYTPLVRSFNRLTFHKAMFATIITFLIAGLWHGSSWLFVIFGGLHGIGLVVNHYWKKTKLHMNNILAWVITFNFINITFVFFRAKEWDDAVKVLHGMVSINNIMLPIPFENKLSFLSQFNVTFGNYLLNIAGTFYTLIWIAAAFLLILLFKNSNELLKTFAPNKKHALVIIMFFIVSIVALNSVAEREFLYFNF